MKTVAIIGGGPAGATAAERLACAPQWNTGPNHRMRVTVFEEKLGWEKPCGGGLSFKALARYPYLVDGREVKCIREAEFVAPNGKRVRFRLRRPLAIYSRSVLNRSLLERAANAGAEISEDRIVGLDRGSTGWRLQGRLGTYRSDYVILAGGARSRLRQLVAEDFKARDFMLTFGYYVPVRDDLLRIKFFEDFEGYAWSFPRSDHLSVGVCGKVGEGRMTELRGRLHDFMKEFGYPTASAAVFSHLLPALKVESWSTMPLAGPGWALIGDAGGLVDPVTGEGIYYAMRSAELLAESLLQDSPASYPARARREFGRALALGARLAPIFYREHFLGTAMTTRLLEFARWSEAFMGLLQDLIEGSQDYRGLAPRLYRTLGNSLAGIFAAFLRQRWSGMAFPRFNRPMSAEENG